MYCNLGGLKGWKIVLQYREVYCNGAIARLRNCIAGHQGVLQYRECRGLNCIAIGVKEAGKLYCRVLNCMAIDVQWVHCITTWVKCIVTQYTVSESLFGHCL